MLLSSHLLRPQEPRGRRASEGHFGLGAGEAWQEDGDGMRQAGRPLCAERKAKSGTFPRHLPKAYPQSPCRRHIRTSCINFDALRAV
jgi:hypothetical protein